MTTSIRHRNTYFKLNRNELSLCREHVDLDEHAGLVDEAMLSLHLLVGEKNQLENCLTCGKYIEETTNEQIFYLLEKCNRIDNLIVTARDRKKRRMQSYELLHKLIK